MRKLSLNKINQSRVEWCHNLYREHVATAYLRVVLLIGPRFGRAIFISKSRSYD